MPQTTSDKHTWTSIDKSAWRKGEWQSEPDKVQYKDPNTSYPCLIMRNELGALCGYVGVTEEHPLFAIGPNRVLDDNSYPEDRLVVHGGVTFASFCQEDNAEHDRVFWYGFDCCHWDDLVPTFSIAASAPSDTYKNVAYVKEQVASLALQLHELR